MSSKVFTLAILAGLTSGIFAQSSNYAIIPFKLAGKFIYVEASADGRPGNFIIDTGCPGLVLNSRYFEDIEENSVVYDINGQSELVGGRNVGLNLGPLSFPVTYASVARLNTVEGQAPGIPIMGLIGASFFRDFELEFDFVKGELTLCRLDKKGRKIGFLPPHSNPTDTFPLVFKGHLPCLKVGVGEATLCFAIDSGANVNVLHRKGLRKVSPYLKGQREVQLAGLGQQAESVTFGLLTGVELGGTEYLPMQTVVQTIEHFNNNLPGPEVDGIMGFHFLRQYKTAINLKKKELYIWDEGNRDRAPAERDVMVINH